MAYQIRVTREAEEDFASLPAFHRSRLRDAIAIQLEHEPAVPTRNRKLLAMNPYASWELRVGDWRVLYDVDDSEEERTVTIVAFGRKVGNKFVVRGQEWEL